MNYFNHHMSYTDLSRSLAVVCEQQRLLSSSEIKCLERSLTDPFLQKMLNLYPLSMKLKNLVTRSFEHQRAEHRLQHNDTNVHNTIYGGQRERTARYLQETYPVQSHAEVIEKLEAFLNQIFLKEDAKAELRISEAERYAHRKREYAAGNLTRLIPAHSLEQIQTDFMEYVTHLRKIHQANSTYCWELLSSFFQRLESLDAQSGLAEAELMLLRALDDARTAYHDQSNTHIPEKTYSCQAGMHQRLLDHHAGIVPTQRNREEDFLEQTILALTQPFILKDTEQQGRVSCSEGLYQLYLNAAGYRLEEREEAYFELRTGADTNVLREQYLQSVGQNRLKRIRAQNAFNSVTKMFNDIPAEQLETSFSDLFSFFRAQEGLLERVEKKQSYLIAPSVPFESEVIIARMLEQGPFIDRAHLEMVLALHNENASLELMNQVALSGVAGIEGGIQTSREYMQQMYERYLNAQEQPFYHFIHEQGLSDKFNSRHFETVGCSEAVLCQWLEQGQENLPQQRAQRLAFLCAEAGYAVAINWLCGRGGISPDYIDIECEQSLLMISTRNGHLQTVRSLITAGAQVNLQNRYGQSPLINAASSTQLEVLRELLVAGADVNLRKGDGVSALMVGTPSLDIVRELIAAGADINFRRTWDGCSALCQAAWDHNSNIDVVRALIAAGAEVNISNTQHNETILLGVLLHLYMKRHIQHELLIALIMARAFDYRLALHPVYFFMMVAVTLAYVCDDTLKRSGLRQNLLSQEEIFASALRSGHRDSITRSIAAGVNINRLVDGETALHVAIENGTLDIVSEILQTQKLARWVVIKELKRCIENPDYHQTVLPLLLAYPNIVGLIIHNHHKAPLLWATEHQCVPAVQAFIDAGVPLDEMSVKGETALMIAQRLGNAGLVDILSRYSQALAQTETIYSGEQSSAPLILSENQRPEMIKPDMVIRRPGG